MNKASEEIIFEADGHPGVLVDVSQIAIAVSEGAGHTLQSVNPAFCRLLGKPCSSFAGKPLAEVMRVDAAAASLLDQVFQSGKPASLMTGAASGEFAADRKPVPRSPDADGRACWNFAVSPLLDSFGHPAGLVIQISQSTQRVGIGPSDPETYDVIRTANERLLIAALREEERADALLQADQAKDEFLAMLAHELRNPLAAIRTGVYLISQRLEDVSEELQRPCDLIKSQIHHLARLLDDLLDVSRITTGKIQLRMEPIDVVSVSRQAASTIRAVVEHNQHELTLALPSEPVWVNADPVRLVQVIANLLHNAAKYTHPGGHIWLKVEKDAGTAGDSADGETGSMGAGEAVIRVLDTGIGISEDNLATIFDPFVQTEGSSARAQGGLGIGLTLARRLVEMQGGSVCAVSSGIDRGSEFIIRLPLCEGNRHALLPAEEPAVPARRNGTVGQRVLVVDDNIDVAALLQDVLELWGYAAEVVHSGDEAIGAALAAPPDVILLDIGLPGMDGYQVAETLRKKTDLDRTLLVAMTGFGQETDRARAREAGFDFHLTKPVDLDELRATIAIMRKTEDTGAEACAARTGETGAGVGGQMAPGC